MNGFSFAQMLTALMGPHGGTWAYRRAWGSGAIKIRLVTMTHQFAMDANGRMIDWVPCQADMYADDWELAP